MVKIIADIGSCHGGRPDYAREAIDIAKDAGVDVVKFQLFKGDKNGNIELPRQFWPDIVKHAREVGIDIFASVFDEDAIDLLKETGIKKAKLAYSQNFNLKLIKKLKEEEFEIWASGGTENFPTYANVKLFCIPQYPVKTGVTTFVGDTVLFNGLSSHWLGYKEDMKTLAHLKNWKYLEKHFHTSYKVDCPDYWFALNPKELKEMVKCLKS